MSTRTQVYFTREQRDQLDAIARREGRTLASVVREAVGEYLVHRALDAEDLNATLDRHFGSMPDLEVPPRGEWDRDAWGDSPGG